MGVESSAEYRLPAAIRNLKQQRHCLIAVDVAPLVEYERMNSESRPASGMFKKSGYRCLSLHMASSLSFYSPPGLTKRVDYPARASRNPLRDRRTRPRRHSSTDSRYSHALAHASPLTGARVTGILSPILHYDPHPPTHDRPRREAMSMRFRPIETFAKAGQHVF